ncbi:DNA-binding response regulator [Aquimarina sp. AD1]|uniref:LytR/AlgR family response regulator transcription factor n=1 Tax=Aquimarina TaxID=290174 RepID=UPI0004026FE4|nr:MULTISPECIES: LytTR family transcriptional regulator DNA-binding domain-containing protein [Aquimarina]AXT55155.1 DNA-binding response regulator [Aquimarina sp. AD1]RKN19627.1 DNA-binding response regulator [Aquimarina sp. AD1]
MNCIIVEDQLPAQRILKKYIEDMGSLKLIGTFTDAIEAMQLMKSTKVDVIFLDIHLPKISGIDFLKTLSNPPQVILTTAFPDYALESYEFDVVDYLLKPFSFQRFIKAVSKVENKKQQLSLDANTTEIKEVYAKIGFDHVRILIDDITYIISDTDYTEIHLQDKKLVSSETLRYWEELLPSKNFMRVHKSYIINTSKIEKFSGNQIYLSNQKTIPLGRAYKSNFTKKIL